MGRGAGSTDMFICGESKPSCRWGFGGIVSVLGGQTGRGTWAGRVRGRESGKGCMGQGRSRGLEAGLSRSEPRQGPFVPKRLPPLYLGGYHEEHPVILCLWEALAAFSAEDQRAFLKFITACSRAPLLGFRWGQGRGIVPCCLHWQWRQGQGARGRGVGNIVGLSLLELHLDPLPPPSFQVPGAPAVHPDGWRHVGPRRR